MGDARTHPRGLVPKPSLMGLVTPDDQLKNFLSSARMLSTPWGIRLSPSPRCLSWNSKANSEKLNTMSLVNMLSFEDSR